MPLSYAHFGVAVEQQIVVSLSLDAHSPELSPLDAKMATLISDFFAFSFYWIVKGTLCAISNSLYENEKFNYPYGMKTR